MNARTGNFTCKICSLEKPLKGERRGLCFDCHNSRWRANHGLPSLEEDRLKHRLSTKNSRQKTDKRFCVSCQEIKDIDSFVIAAPIRVMSTICRGCRPALGSHLRLRQPERLRLFNLPSASHCHICETKVTFYGQTGCKKDSGNLDHDHTTGDLRGVLCWTCNVAIGKFKDSTALLKKAILYLERSSWSE